MVSSRPHGVVFSQCEAGIPKTTGLMKEMDQNCRAFETHCCSNLEKPQNLTFKAADVLHTNLSFLVIDETLLLNLPMSCACARDKVDSLNA